MAVIVAFDAVGMLAPDDRVAMQALLQRHFHGVDSETFAADLTAKTHVLRLFDEVGSLIGFSTVAYGRDATQPECEALVVSGDTIVDPQYWDRAELGAAWVAAVLDLHSQHGGGELWWLLLTSGVRTYRYLSLCVERYAPASDDRCDPQAAQRLPILARAVYGTAYDVDTGIVRLSRPQTLRRHLESIPDHLAGDPATAFFCAHNPGAARGDELASLCRLSEGNLSAVGRLTLRRGRALWTQRPVGDLR